jgi:pilus assembly protein CpaE
MYLVTDSSVPSIRQARRLIDFYTEDNLNLKIDIVIGQEKRPVVKGKHHTEAAKVLERSFEHWLPFDPRAARESVDQGKPLSQVAGRSPLTRAIARLGKDTISALAAGETAIGAQRK